MGFAMAKAAVAAGAKVDLIAGPVHLETPMGVTRIDVVSAAEMHSSTLARTADADIFIATAAVADYRPTSMAEQKIKKTADTMSLELRRNPDILADIASLPNKPFCLGFAAETHDLEIFARQKLEHKHLDMLAANPVNDNQGFDHDDNTLYVYWKEGETYLPSANKQELAKQLLQLLIQRLP